MAWSLADQVSLGSLTSQSLDFLPYLETGEKSTIGGREGFPRSMGHFFWGGRRVETFVVLAGGDEFTSIHIYPDR